MVQAQLPLGRRFRGKGGRAGGCCSRCGAREAFSPPSLLSSWGSLACVRAGRLGPPSPAERALRPALLAPRRRWWCPSASAARAKAKASPEEPPGRLPGRRRPLGQQKKRSPHGAGQEAAACSQRDRHRQPLRLSPPAERPDGTDGRTDSAAMAESNLKRCQNEAEEVTVVMMANFNKVLDREGKLSDLDQRAEDLRNQSCAFSKTTKALSQKHRWANTKYKVILGAVVAVAILLLLALVLYFTLPGSGAQDAPAKASTAADGN